SRLAVDWLGGEPRSPCCARAASGHAVAAPPMSVMSSRRLIASGSRASDRKITRLGGAGRPTALRDFERRPDGGSPLRLDCVAKVFLAFGRETLIQDRARTSNNDSKEPTLRFDCYKFLFHRACLATFATQSLKSDHRRSTCDPSLSAQKLSHASQQNLSFDHLVYLGNHAS